MHAVGGKGRSQRVEQLLCRCLSGVPLFIRDAEKPVTDPHVELAGADDLHR